MKVQLLGTPGAVRDEAPVGVRGNKSWLLLAYLLLSPAPVPRSRLAALLFADAADPAGALRWNLSHLRKTLGVELSGDPIVFDLPEAVEVDLVTLRSGDAEAAVELPGLDRELLAGVDVTGSVEVEMWLEDERRHARQMVANVRHEAALARLGRGDAIGALALARKVVARAPYDENAAALLVRCLRSAGRPEEASDAAGKVAKRLREELGVEPTETLWSALAAPPGGERRAHGRDAVLAQLETGRSAVVAGAVDAGLGALRSATIAARALGDGHLLSATLVELGSALIHAVRGVDQDGLALLHEALPLAEEHGAGDLATTAMREIGYVDMLRARYERGMHWFARARGASGGDPAQDAWTGVYDGAVLSDIGDGGRATELLRGAVDVGIGSHDEKLVAFALAFLGRQALLDGDPDAAVAELERSREGARRASWTAFVGFPESLLADALRMRGQLAEAREVGEHALAVSEQVSDPCWESLSLRSLGLIAVDEGRVEPGVDLLVEAPPRCRRLPDTYIWIETYGLDALASVAVRHGLPSAPGVVDELARSAATYGMTPLRDRAHAYRAGVPTS